MIASGEQNSQQQIATGLTMTVEEAEQVIWQDLYHPRKPIGELLRTKQIRYGHLCWAVEGAPTREMRVASRTILTHWLGSSATFQATQRYGPEVVEGSRYLEDKELDSLMHFSVYLGGSITAAVFILWTFIGRITSGDTGALSIPMYIAIGVLIYSLLGWWAFSKIRRHFVDYKNSRRGRAGESSVVEEIRSGLDNRWTIFRNLQIPGYKDDIDIALVGPGGVWAIEVKSFQSTVRVQNTEWERRAKQGWRRLDRNPSRQVTQNAKRLNTFLQENAISRWVECAIALSEPQPVSHFTSSKVPVWLLPSIRTQMADLATRNPPSEDEIERIALLLKEQTRKQIAIEEARYRKS